MTETKDRKNFLDKDYTRRQFLKLSGKSLAGLALSTSLLGVLGVTKEVWNQPGYPAEAKDRTFRLTVKQGPDEYVIDAAANEPLLVAMERAGIKAPSRCRSGQCGWCRSRLLSGECYIPEETDGRRWADAKYGYVHPCATFPVSDVTLEVPGEYL